MNLENFYKHYKALLIIPITLLIFSGIILGITYSKTGDFLNKDISLKGGITVTIYKSDIGDVKDIEAFLKEKVREVNVRELTDYSTQKKAGLIIEASDIKEDELRGILEEKIDFTDKQYSSEETGSALGESFYKELVLAILASFLFMSIVVFITFRKFIPSIAVVASVILDIIATLAIVNLIGIKISTAGISAFLLLIGYSIDTDIVLTTKVLKNRTYSDVMSNVKAAMKTGLVMTLTAIVALLAGIFFSNSEVLRDMFIIILIGLIVDMISTWIMNTSLLIWYCKKKGIT